MFYAVQAGGLPAFNYMVPGPHPYIMGDSYVAPMHSDLVEGQNLYGGLTLNSIDDLVKEHAPIRNADGLIAFMHATYNTAAEERSMKNMVSVPHWKLTELDELTERSHVATTPVQFAAALDELQEWIRDIEAPMARSVIRKVRVETLDAAPLEPGKEAAPGMKLPFNLTMPDFKDKRVWIGSGLVLATLFILSRRGS